MDVTDHTSPYRVPTFTYAGPPEGPAYEAWREEFCRRFCHLDAETASADRIACAVEISQVGSLSFGTAHGSSGSFIRTRSLLADGQDDLVLLTAITGDALAVQRGRSIELRPSEMCLTSLDHVGESRLSEGGRYTALRMPRRDLMAICVQKYRGQAGEAARRKCGPEKLHRRVLWVVRRYGTGFRPLYSAHDGATNDGARCAHCRNRWGGSVSDVRQRPRSGAPSADPDANVREPS